MGLWGISRHSSLRALLSSYINGEASARQAKRLEQHLAGCEECRLELEALRATVGLIRELPELQVPRSFSLVSPPVAARVPLRLAWATGIATSLAALLVVALLAGDTLGILNQTTQIGQTPAAVSLAAAPAAAAPAPEAPAPAAAQAAPAPEAAVAALPAPRMAAAAVPPPEPEAEAAPVAMAAAAPPEEVSVETAGDEVERPETVSPLAGAVEAEAVASEPVDTEVEVEDEGVALPLWQMELAASGVMVLLSLATVWTVRRRRSSPWV